MLRLNDSWVWDSWYAREGDHHHAFYLRASRGLGDPNRRHTHPSVGHAVSPDLREWTVQPDALAVSPEPWFDDRTTWTGSVVRADDGLWWMFYTGTSRAEPAVQRVSWATSHDLQVWTKSESAALEADARWYERWGTADWHDEAWRDPFVFRGEDGRWHMYLTARATHGDLFGRGVVGHAVSDDLRGWQVLPPLTEPTSGFGQLEVTQVAVVDGVPTLVFCCGPAEMTPALRARYPRGGIFSVTGPSLHGPFDVATATRFPQDDLYAGRLVATEQGWHLIGFWDTVDGRFVGELSDPIPVTSRPGHGLTRLS